MGPRSPHQSGVYRWHPLLRHARMLPVLHGSSPRTDQRHQSRYFPTPHLPRADSREHRFRRRCSSPRHAGPCLRVCWDPGRNGPPNSSHPSTRRRRLGCRLDVQIRLVRYQHRKSRLDHGPRSQRHRGSEPSASHSTVSAATSCPQKLPYLYHIPRSSCRGRSPSISCRGRSPSPTKFICQRVGSYIAETHPLACCQFCDQGRPPLAFLPPPCLFFPVHEGFSLTFTIPLHNMYVSPSHPMYLTPPGCTLAPLIFHSFPLFHPLNCVLASTPFSSSTCKHMPPHIYPPHHRLRY